MRKPTKPRRPLWITLNKVLLGLHWMADEDGFVVAAPAEMARHAQVGWRAIDSALQCLEFDGHLTFVDSSSLPWTVRLHDMEPEPCGSLVAGSSHEVTENHGTAATDNGFRPMPTDLPSSKFPTAKVPPVQAERVDAGGYVQQHFAW